MEAANENDYFTVTLYQMDIERVRYSLSRYLRTRCVPDLVSAVLASLQRTVGPQREPPLLPPTRLLKIENAVEFLEMSTEAHDRLSFHEKKYHAKLKELNDAHFDELAFGKLSERVKGTVLETDRDRLAHAHPNLQEFVFCKVTEDIRNVEVSPDLEPMNLDRGDVHVMQYAAVQQYVLDGSIQLL